ncbi:MAG: hypothetical protein HGA45_37360, partial [Chloroflexales bacterium]|nr:hypothetical protein [Chloroflexales bacterium]
IGLESPLSPPAGPRLMSEQRWPIQLIVRYTPAAPAPRIPDLCAAFAQPARAALASLSPLAPLGEVELGFGQALVVATEGASELLLS